MDIETFLLYLVGQKQAIYAIAANPWSIWIGLLFVLSAGFARSYQSKDLLSEPWHIFLPLVFSLVLSFFLCSAIWFPLPKEVSFWHAYRSFLGLFWMLAPLAWLYAIPFGIFSNTKKANIFRLWTLAFVALWRVALMCWVFYVLLESIRAVFVIILFCDIIAVAAVTISSTYRSPNTPHIIGLMGGLLEVTSYEEIEKHALIKKISYAINSLGILTLPIWVIGIFKANHFQDHWQPLFHAPGAFPAHSLWYLAIFSIIFWLLPMCWTQPKQKRRCEVEKDLKNGHIEQAIETMKSFDKKNFPTHWQLPPAKNFHDSPTLLDIMQKVVEIPTQSWVYKEYLQKFSYYLKEPLWYWMYDEKIKQIVAILQKMPQGTEIAKNIEKSMPEFKKRMVSSWATFRAMQDLMEGKSEQNSLEEAEEKLMQKSFTEVLKDEEFCKRAVYPAASFSKERQKIIESLWKLANSES